MAPEVLLLQGYNLKADVYSFALVLWEMLSAQTPFAGIKTKGDLIDHVSEYYIFTLSRCR